MKFEIHKEGKAPLVRILVVLILFNTTSFMLFPDTIFTVLLLGVSIAFFATALNFYKQPERTYKGDLHGLVNAPTDGRIVVIEKVFEKEFFQEERIQISIFMSLFNAHSNWVPVSGKITHYSHVNGTILTKQIAGAMARRIVTYVKEGDELHIGSPLGFIKLGSRMDIFLPLDSEILVSMGEEVRANITFLARLNKQNK